MDVRSLTVFTVIPPIYQSYPEFQLCLKLFRRALPPGATFIADEYTGAPLRQVLGDHLNRAAPFVLLVKEPAVILARECIEVMLDCLEEAPGVACVLPSDIRGHRKGSAPYYYTLRGFERFSASLGLEKRETIPYDGRDPWMFMVRRDTLMETGIPANPMDIPSLLPAGEAVVSLNAYIHPFIDYDLGTMRAEMLPLVPENVTSLLDIGCYTGSFGALVRERLHCRVVGSEMNADAAELARQRLDAVFPGDIMAADITETFDCITCLDVFEHIVDTGKFLSRMRDLLNDGGYLVLSIPNVGHWSIIEDLLEGRWDYVPAGTLCMSHLRFFTRHSMVQVLEEAGFVILSVRENDTGLPSRAAEILPLLRRTGTAVDEKSLSSLGYYIVAEKARRNVKE